MQEKDYPVLKLLYEIKTGKPMPGAIYLKEVLKVVVGKPKTQTKKGNRRHAL